MRRLALTTALLGAVATTLSAQGPGGPPNGGPLANSAQFLLAHTGELRLTDAQVVRLAAIARRTEERQRAMRATMDSMRPARPMMDRDSTARAEMGRRAEQMRGSMERVREQSRADRRDAIAVLTAEQQALAWEMVAAGGRVQRAGAMRQGGPRQGMQRERRPDAGRRRLER